jgi:hypothetical protein
VEVLRVNTTNWIAINVEAIVGVGDIIRTGENGRARITFFADGVDTELEANTQYQIDRFEGDGESFQITVSVLVGQTTQRLDRILDANSSYEIQTPGMALAARGTQFRIRVEESGRSGMLVSEGTVQANKDEMLAEVPPEFGIRATEDEPLSDVVRANTFDELDAALDGCAAELTTVDDVRLNVRLGPSLDFPRIGTIDASEVTNLMGTIEAGGWYRIAFRGGFGWILSSNADVVGACAGLRLFPDDWGPEDVSQYTSLGDEISIDDLRLPTPEATPSG